MLAPCRTFSGASPHSLADPKTRVLVSDHERHRGGFNAVPAGAGARVLGFPPRDAQNPTSCPERRVAGSIGKLAAVAVGEAEAFIQHPRGSEWGSELFGYDWAAGVACVLAAGGVVFALNRGGSDARTRGSVRNMLVPVPVGKRVFRPAGDMIIAANCLELAIELAECAVATRLSTTQMWQFTSFPRSTASRVKLLCLDRDGVLNHDVGSPGVVREEDFRVVDGAREAVHLALSLGVQLAVVTNQSCIGKGLLSEPVLEQIHAKLRRELGVTQQELAIFTCTHTEADGCLCRKPHPTLLNQARVSAELLRNDVDRSRLPFSSLHGAESSNSGTPLDRGQSVDESVVFIGDMLTDIQAARAANVRAAVIRSRPHGVRTAQTAATVTGQPVPVFTSLFDAVCEILLGQ
mmetsp:Transcript_13246/g.28755  ORF Transcript_13246/g.28755 Transcript_13246/m.28755 type:complete len:406 (+) Transcript_13246:2-1219(+)